MLKPLESDRVRRTLQSHLADVEIAHDNPGGCTVAPYRIKFRDDKWYQITAIIRKLGGDWVKYTIFRGHWRIPK